MPRRGRKYFTLVKGAEEAMLKFRMEIANDLGYGTTLQDSEENWKKLTTEQAGNIGGEVVRRIQAAGEQAILDRYKAGQSLMPNIPNVMDVRNVTNTGNQPA